MKRIALGLLLAAVSGPAWGQTCASLPYTLTNGTVANADQVMADLNCLALRGGTTFTGNVGIGANPDAPLLVYSSLFSGGIHLLGNTSGAANLTANNGPGSWNPITAAGDVVLTWETNSPNNGMVIAPHLATTSGIRVANSGLVGIGVSSPTQTLDVNGHIKARNTYGFVWTDSFGGQPTLQMQSDNNWVFYNTNASGASYPVFSQMAHASNSPMLFHVPILNDGSGTSWIMGGLGIGTTSPSKLLYVNGSAGGTQSWNQASDGRLKTDIAPVTGGLALIERLNPIRYHWREPDDRSVGKDLNLPVGERQIGFIAQEVEKVVPEAVTTPAKGSSETYGLKQDNLIPVLVAAIKEQQAQIKAQNTKISALEEQIGALKRQQ